MLAQTCVVQRGRKPWVRSSPEKTFVTIQPNAVTVSNSHGILDPEGVVHRAQAEGLVVYHIFLDLA